MNFTDIDKIIYKYVTENASVFLKMSTVEIAKKCFTTPTSVTRLIQKLGYSSLKEFKIDISFFYLNNENFNEKNFIENLGNIYTKTFAKTVQSLKIEQIKQCTEAIIDSEKIILYGAGSNYGCVYEFTSNLQKIGINAICSESFQRTITNLPSLLKHKNALVILVSKNMNGMDKKKILDFSNENSIKTIIISEKEILQTNIISITYPKIYTKLKITSTPSIICTYYIFEAIFNILIHKYAKNFVYYDEEKGEIYSEDISRKNLNKVN